MKVWCDWLLGNNDTWWPVSTAEPFAQLAQLATRLEGLKGALGEVLELCLSEEAYVALAQAGREEFDLVRLEEDAILCGFDPWFRGLAWDSYRQFAPRTVALARAVAAKRLHQILLAVDFLEGLDQPVLKWSLPDNSHVCLVSDTSDQVSRDMAVSHLTALIARDEYVLEESYSGEEEGEEGEEGRVRGGGMA